MDCKPLANNRLFLGLDGVHYTTGPPLMFYRSLQNKEKSSF